VDSTNILLKKYRYKLFNLLLKASLL